MNPLNSQTSEAELGQQRDFESDANIRLPFEGADTVDLPLSKQWRIKQANARGSSFVVEPWRPGKQLQLCCATWNMAQNDANSEEVGNNFIMPNAHIIAITSQENGPYVGTNTAHDTWDETVTKLLPAYTKIASSSLWAVHVMIFARTADVYPHVCEVHTDSVKTGSMANSLGNKGGVGIAFSLRMKSRQRSSVDGNAKQNNSGSERPKVTSPAVPQQTSVMTFLFIGAHLTAHQENQEKRNEDYLHIIRNLKLGATGIYEQRFVKRMRRAALSSGVSPVFPKKQPLPTGNEDTLQIPPQTPSTSLAGRSYTPLPTRDVTEEFDVCCFFGDLNYRINGTAGAIRHIIKNNVALRAALAANDQLIKEMAKGIVFHGFEELPLTFRPTYKLKKVKVSKKDAAGSEKEREKAKSDKVLVVRRQSVDDDVDDSDEGSPAPSTSGKKSSYYDWTQYQDGPKARMPAYCDRVLLKTNFRTMAPETVRMGTYTDVLGLSTSDHRPVVLMSSIKTDNRDNVLDDNEPTSSGLGCY